MALVVRHVLVRYELHENFSKHIGKLVCRHGAKPCNKETELLGTLKAGITTT
ncbi:MarR family transcriptional regulator [Leptotrichia wadei]|uniref:MarR family transcriptional regulator n=1 Tax=Leptotrichia wadei TaxID=157687 RepID=UPI0028EF8DB0|nr:MarR family transcriptional regulator [Leptotrichia wadei]